MNILRFRRWTSVLAVVLVIGAVGCYIAGGYMCGVTLLPDNHRRDLEGNRKTVDGLFPGIVEWHDDLREAGVFKDTTITGEGGFALHAAYATASDPASAQGTAIVIHGYSCNHFSFMHLIRMYRDSLNFNVLAPDLNSHGTSGGEAVQMGWKDRLDILRWVGVAHGVFEDDFMVIHGVSMGGATTMMTSGEETPPYVRAFVEDCGYTSVWDEFKHVMRRDHHLPAFPILHCASVVCKLRYGWSFKEASSLRQLAKSVKPMLFIHGDSDTLVPTEHVHRNFEAKTKGYKELWVAPATEHCDAFINYPGEYTVRVGAFLRKVRSEDL